MNRFLNLLRVLDIKKEESPLEHALTVILNAGVELNLTAYDGCYLELAQRLELPLVTSDRKLTEAARSSDVLLFP